MQRRIAELEATIAQETTAHARLKTAHLDDAEAHRLNVSNLREEINALNARSEGAERLLAEARAELRERNTTIRALEQSALENSVKLQTAEQTQAELERILAGAHAKQAETESARASLEARAGDLSRELDNRTTALKRAEEQIAALESSMAAEVKLAISELESRDALIARLRADLETQSSARAFAEGALQSARQERVSWRNSVDANAAATSEARDKLTRLRA
jgi:chromosome segregation ATPase